MSKKIEVKGVKIQMETINGFDYVNLTDIAKQSPQKPAFTIRNWLRNSKTLLFLETWETLHNENFKVAEMSNFRLNSANEQFYFSVQTFVAETAAIGLISKSGRYGGTFARTEIALDFCAWYSPQFKVYLYNEFDRLKRLEEKTSQFYLNKILNNTLEASQLSQFLLDGQKLPKEKK